MSGQQGKAYSCAAVCFSLLAIFLVYKVSTGRFRPVLSSGKSGQGLGFRFQYGEWCDMLVNSGGWLGIPHVRCTEYSRNVATCGTGLDNNWQWSPDALSCGALRLDPQDISRLLHGKWVVIAGDSISRYFYAALLRALANDEHQIVYGHQDFEYILQGNIRATFLWAPYATNLSSIFDTWDTTRGTTPDVIVLSAGLWHMLHISDVDDYLHCLGALRHAAQAFVGRLAKDQPIPNVSFFSLTQIYPPKLKTEEKRQRLTLANLDLYNRAIAESNVLVPEGLFYLVDIHQLTSGCGPLCTHDGLHYSNATYDTAVQIWANNINMLAQHQQM